MLGGLFRKKADKTSGAAAGQASRALGPDDPTEAEINQRFLKLLVRRRRICARLEAKTLLTFGRPRRINLRCPTMRARPC